MKPTLTRYGDTNTFHRERLEEVWEKIRLKLSDEITPEVWISEVNDYKGCLSLTWVVKPTEKMKKIVNDIWVKDFNEGLTEHFLQTTF